MHSNATNQEKSRKKLTDCITFLDSILSPIQAEENVSVSG